MSEGASYAGRSREVRLERRLAAVFALDMVGYSRLMESDETDTLTRMNSVRSELIDPAIERHRGRVVKGTGDGLLAEFGSAVDAVECAADIQQGIEEREADTPQERRVRFRIGINVGDIVARDGDIFGDGVNVAARIESLADPGGIVVSDSAYHQVHNKVELRFEDLGPHQLKNLEKPVRVYRVLRGSAVPGRLPGWRRLRQGKVVQWMVAYFAAAWLTLELFDLVAEQFLWPLWVRQGATVVLLFGLLVTLVLAWQHGERGRQKVGFGEIALLAVLLGLAGGSVWVLKSRSDPSVSANASVGFSFRAEPLPEHSVAVLPCSNLGAAEGQEHFADGLAAELITRLSAVSELRVPSQTSSFTFKGQNATIEQIASALRVRNVLECGVTGDGSRLRVSTRLVDAESGYTLWSQAYDREALDLLDVQQEIAQAVVGRLQVELQGNEADRLTRSWTEDPQAYDHFLRGIQYQLRAPTADNVAAGIREFERAIELDLTFGRAYARLAVQQIVVGNMMLGSPAEAYAEAERLAQKAIELDGELFEAYWALGWAELVFRHRWEKAREHFQRTIALAPGEWAGYHSLGMAEGTLGNFDRAMEAARIAFDLDPLAYWPSLGLRTAHLRLRDFDAAVRQLEAQVEVQPDDPWSRALLGELLARLGRGEEAERYLVEAEALAPEDPMLLIGTGVARAIAGDSVQVLALLESFERSIEPDQTYRVAASLAYAYSQLERRDEAMRWLTEARDAYDSIIMYLWHAAFDSLRGDPRFAAFIRELGLPEAVYLESG